MTNPAPLATMNKLGTLVPVIASLLDCPERDVWVAMYANSHRSDLEPLLKAKYSELTAKGRDKRKAKR